MCVVVPPNRVLQIKHTYRGMKNVSIFLCTLLVHKLITKNCLDLLLKISLFLRHHDIIPCSLSNRYRERARVLLLLFESSTPAASLILSCLWRRWRRKVSFIHLWIFLGVQLCAHAFFICTMLQLMLTVMQEMGQCSSILVSIVMEMLQWH